MFEGESSLISINLSDLREQVDTVQIKNERHL